MTQHLSKYIAIQLTNYFLFKFIYFMGVTIDASNYR